MSMVQGGSVKLDFNILAADLSTGGATGSFDLIAPQDGYLDAIYTTVQVAIVTGGVLAVKTGDALAVTVTGLNITIANSAAKGTRQSKVFTPSNAPTNRKVLKGDRISIDVDTAFNGGGAIAGYLVLASADQTAQ